MSAEENLKKLNLILPKAADPVGSYVATKISGKLFRYDSNEAKDIHLALTRRVKKNSFIEI